MIIVDEVVGAYIAWSEKACLQRTEDGCCYAETDECEEGAYESGVGGHISKGNLL